MSQSEWNDRPIPGEWVLRRLVDALPREFKDRHGLDLIECHRDAWNEGAKGRGALRSVLLWLRAASTLVGAVLLQRYRAMWEGRKEFRGEGDMGWEMWGPEIRFGARGLIRRPGFTLVVVMTLGLGVGANTAVFSVLHSIVMTPLPYENSEQLVRIYGSRLDRPGEFDRLQLAAPVTAELRDEVEGLAAVAILQNYSPEGVDVSGGERPERLRLLRVNADYFRTLSLSPVAGRTFLRTEETVHDRLAVVREDVWQRYLGGRPDALGSTLVLNGEAVTVIGVMSDAVRDPIEGRIDIWMPADLRGDQAGNWDDNYLSAIARLAPGTDLVGLRSELDVIERRHLESSETSEKGFVVVPLRTDLVGGVEPLLKAIMGAVLFLLLLTCVNMASLLLARAASRERELAIRTSLGSPRSGLVRHFMIEALLLSVLGGLAGLAIGMGALELILAASPPGLPRREGVILGPEAMVFAASASVIIGLVLGLSTALPFTRPRVDQVVSGPRSGGTASGRTRLRAALVSVEVALAVLLLSGAGILLRTVQELGARDLGADPSGVLTFEVGLPSARYDADEDRYEFNRAFHERVAAIPGVISVAATSRLPVTGSYNTFGSRRAYGVGRPFETENVQVNQRWIAGDFFATAGLELAVGRLFSAIDNETSIYRTVVNRTLVRRLFADENPLGEMLYIAGRYSEIVGVVEDEALTVRGPAAPIAYHHQRQWISGNRQLTQMVSVAGDPEAILPDLRASLARIDPELVLFQPRMLADVIGIGMEQERFAAMLLAVFAVLAIVVAGLGLYGLLSHLVGTIRHEIGVRIALGADRTGVLGMIVARGLSLTVTGALIGLGLTIALGRTLEAFVFQVSPRDPLVLMAAPVVLILVAAVASTVPALRATRVDPVESFRSD